MNLLKGSWVLKVAALVLAVVTYFFINKDMMDKQRQAIDPSYKLLKMTSRNLEVRVRIASSPPSGYRIPQGSIRVEPGRLLVVGPEALLEDAVVETSLIDVSEAVKPFKRRVPLESVAGIRVSGDPYTAEVMVPIEKIPETQ
ncbi:MAG: hypothetical protein A3D28_01870 [Omnitrophica bacterium RIFCSPHIGHO2_02_FULL_63_14]|nr:MAG: hypothetical protein A3D28_01870 [Omnitrophica bacterium RIFCSPHIGHO2_02_FULL_63_14]